MSGKNETKFWKLIKQRTPEIRWNRIENAINSGIPDLLGSSPGSNFFTVELINGSVLATPIDSSGLLKPVTMNLVDPMKYFKERAEGKF